MAFRDATALAAPGLGVRKGPLPNTHVAAARAASTARGQSGSWQADFHMEEHVTGGVWNWGQVFLPINRWDDVVTFWVLESD